MGFRPIMGEVLSQDDKSFTVKMPDGGSKIILFSEKTTLHKANDATKSDLKAGEQVSVFGTENPDGSLTAQNIQIGTTTFVRSGQSGQQGQAGTPAATSSPTAKP